MEASKTQTQEGSNGASASASSMDAAFIKRIKIAVATAIIRHKPPDVNAKEYAENLARRLRKKEENWKTRVMKLEDELLRTRQELTMVKLSDTGVDLKMIGTDLNWDDNGRYTRMK